MVARSSPAATVLVVPREMLGLGGSDVWVRYHNTGAAVSVRIEFGTLAPASWMHLEAN